MLPRALATVCEKALGVVRCRALAVDQDLSPQRRGLWLRESHGMYAEDIQAVVVSAFGSVCMARMLEVDVAVPDLCAQ